MNLIVLPEADRELAEAIDHYNDEQPGLGKAFLSEMRGCQADFSYCPTLRPGLSPLDSTGTGYGLG
jgi:hypothetical protein